MHHYKYMGYSIIYHQRIAVLSYFFHSGIFVPYSVFYPQQIKNSTSPTPAKKLLPSVANTFRGRANALFIGFLGIHSSILLLPWEGISSPKEASGNAKAAFSGVSAMFKGFKMGILGCCQVLPRPCFAKGAQNVSVYQGFNVFLYSI